MLLWFKNQNHWLGLTYVVSHRYVPCVLIDQCENSNPHFLMVAAMVVVEWDYGSGPMNLKKIKNKNYKLQM